MRQITDWPMARERMRFEMQQRQREGYTTGVVLVAEFLTLLEERDKLDAALKTARELLAQLQAAQCE